MLFSELILVIMKSVNGQRTVSSPYHLIKGKKSGQTLQDIGYYGLHPYFSLFPKLDKRLYDRVVSSLHTDGFLADSEEAIVLTQKGLSFQPADNLLNGWKYRGKEGLFLKRLSLIVQTFSHRAQDVKRFDPVRTEEEIQRWTKQFLVRIGFQKTEVYERFTLEMEKSLDELHVPDFQKLLILNRLSGLGVSGLTWQQIAGPAGLQPIDAQLLAVEALHGWMQVIEDGEYTLLKLLLEGVSEQPVLTESARRTENLFRQGLSVADIAAVRQLKMSTIEDHFVEIAMNDPSFNSGAFIPEPVFRQILSVSNSLQSKRLRDIKNELPEATYFQIRLALAAKEVTR